MTDHRSTVQQYWADAEARDWDAFDALLTDAVSYALPQTGERISGRDAYSRFNRDYPGDWRLAVREVLVDGDRAVSWVEATVSGQTQQAVTFFDFDQAGRIAGIVDFWPEDYEPPPGREHLVDRA